MENKNPFSLKAGETMYETFTFSGSRVKNFVNLRKAGGIQWMWDFYYKESWRN